MIAVPPGKSMIFLFTKANRIKLSQWARPDVFDHEDDDREGVEHQDEEDVQPGVLFVRVFLWQNRSGHLLNLINLHSRQINDF